jgi:polar amino acid transport system substrate-binding protein
MLNWGVIFGAAITLLPAFAGRVWGADYRFTSLDAAPWAYADASGGLTGAFPEIVAELSRRGGHNISVSLQSFSRIERDLETGQQDCTILLWSEKRAHLVDMGATIYGMPFGVVARQGVALKDYGDLHALSVSMVRGVAFDPRMESDTNIRRDVDKDYAQALQKVAHGRVDAVSGAIPTIRYLAHKMNLSGALGDVLELARLPLTLQCAKSSPKLADMPALGVILTGMVEDGFVPRTLARYGYD